MKVIELFNGKFSVQMRTCSSGVFNYPWTGYRCLWSLSLRDLAAYCASL